MKKIAFLFLSLLLVACSSDDDNDKISLTQEMVVGWWYVNSYSDGGDFKDIVDNVIYINLSGANRYKVKFFTNTYSGTYSIEGNTVKGTTTDPITEYFTFDKLDGVNAEISYKNSEGGSYKFKATKAH